MSRLPVWLHFNVFYTSWWLYALGPKFGPVAEGQGRMVEWHAVGCRCEAPGVGP